MQRGHRVIEHIIGPGLVLLLLTLLASRKRGLALLARKPATQFHQPRRALRHRRRELHKFAVFPLQGEAQLVLAPLRIGPQRGNRTIPFHLERPGIPIRWRAVQLRRTPALDMPAIVRDVLRHLAELNCFSSQVAVLVAVFPLAANPGQKKTATSTADRKSTRLNSSHSQISYAVFCLKKKKKD